ncbi:hypothetical protein MUU77_11800 [Pseudoxanthomonas sp. F37]|jgi:hypothetical protein|uniref:hypothetical protein n=1 Tax=Pseudoxanthomonas TaxID=83618 RepID=UPI001FD42DAA|nr:MULTISPECIES: hypothetical protein [Pseudoxanthomonas]UOV05949.1 hypothetical protein MUU75_04445 [Pseudoxanthomonas mexicana]UOV07547.1 hypothetical protein MUU77_11800 [Pseudoxanthomonas sp. F37]
MKKRYFSVVRVAGLVSLLLSTAPCLASQAEKGSYDGSLESPVLKCYEEYAKRYSATNAAPADIASAAYAHCYDALLSYANKIRADTASSPAIFNVEERVTAARAELEKRAHAAALSQILRSRFDSN